MAVRICRTCGEENPGHALMCLECLEPLNAPQDPEAVTEPKVPGVITIPPITIFITNISWILSGLWRPGLVALAAGG